MVTFVTDGDRERFICAAGVLAHYIGDACQPLHISYLHDGDPEQPTTRTVHHRDGTTGEVNDPLGKGVHSAYEDEMVNAFREQILGGLKQAPKKAKKTEYVANGFEAAQRTIGLMRATFNAIPPVKIVQTFVGLGKGKRGRAEAMWGAFGDNTNRGHARWLPLARDTVGKRMVTRRRRAHDWCHDRADPGEGDGDLRRSRVPAVAHHRSYRGEAVAAICDGEGSGCLAVHFRVTQLLLGNGSAVEHRLLTLADAVDLPPFLLASRYCLP